MTEKSTAELISTLVRYNAWAFERVWACVDNLTEEEFCRDSGYSQGSVRDHFVHVVSATRRWLQRVTGQPVTPHLDQQAYLTKAAVRKLWAEFLTEIDSISTTFTEDYMNEEIEWQISSRNISAKGPRWQVLEQLFNHTTDHRAQILATIHFCFNKPTVEQDFIFYLASLAEAK